MRSALLAKFRLITRDLGAIPSVLVVGGSSDEPELEELRPPPERVMYLNLGVQTVEGASLDWDLNVPMQTKAEAQFVICNQVLEHVWNHQSFFDAIVDSTADGGLIWITCPASNFEHSSPEYYSAGYSVEYLMKNLAVREIEILDHGSISSKRAYIARHFFQFGWNAKRWLNHGAP